MATQPSQRISTIVLIVAIAAIIVGSMAIATVQMVGQEVSQIKEEIKALRSDFKNISGLEEKLNKTIEDVDKVARASGVPLDDPKKLEKALEMKRLYEEARNEGKVVMYVAYALDTLDQVKKTFEYKYPGVTVEFYALSTNGVVERMRGEYDAGKYLVDICESGFMTFDIAERGYLMRYIPMEGEAYPETLKDPEGYFVADRIHTRGIAYNTNLMKPEEAPKKWVDLLDPKYKGKIGLVDPKSGASGLFFFSAMKFVVGPEEWENFWLSFSKQEPIYVASGTISTTKLLAGEYPILIVDLYTVESMKKEGAPVEWVKFEDDPYVSGVTWLGIASRSPHPNAAKLMVEFLLSEEGQVLLSKTEVPSRPGISSKLIDISNLKANPPAGVFAISKDLVENWDYYISKAQEICK